MIIMGDDMPTWNADQYLKFEDERTQPCRDLVGRVSLADVRTVIDLGCGPGNSTGVVAERWPGAEITGLDDSASMIEDARRRQPRASSSGKPNICMFCRMSKQSSSGTRDLDCARSLRRSTRTRIVRNSWRNIQNGFATPIHRVRTGKFCLLSAACLWWRTANRDNAFQAGGYIPLTFPMN